MRHTYWLLLGLYLIVLLVLTFFPFDGFHGTEPVDLRLQAFRTINFALRKGIGSSQFLVLVGNVAAFVPLGVLVPLLTNRRSPLLALALGLALSIAIEAGQLAVSTALGFAYRTADIDDVIVNVFGAFVGWVLCISIVSLRGRLAGATNGG